MSEANFALMLKRRPEITRNDFRKTYVRHGHMAIPLFMAQGVKYYAQVHNLRWSSPQHAQDHAEIDLSQWDAAATLTFSGDPTQSIGAKYYDEVLAEDELRFLLSKPLEHGQQVPPEAITGDVVVFIQDGVAQADYSEWSKRYAEIVT